MTNESWQVSSILLLTTQNKHIEEALSDLNQPIIASANIENAQQCIDQQAICLVILDSIEHCIALREQSTAAIILIHDDIDAALSAGADDCLSLHPQLLKRRVSSLIVSKNRNLAVRQNMADLKQAEDNLRNSHNKLQSILRALPDTVMVLNRDGEYIHIASEDHYQSLAQADDLIDKNLANTLPSHIAQTLQKLIDKTLSHNKILRTQYDLAQEGETYFYHATASPINEDEVVIVVRDTSEQKRAQDNVKESEKNYRRLFENATDAIFVADVMTGSILQANPQASLMLGYSRAELASMTLDEIEADQISIQDQNIAKVSSTNKLTIETQYKRHDGRLIDVEVSSRAILQNGKLILISFVRDITDRNRVLKESERQRTLAEALLDTANALNESSNLNAVLDKILANVSRIIPRESANIMIIEDEVAKVTRHLGYEQGGFEADEISQIVLPLSEADNLKWIVEHKQALRIDDTHNSQLFNWVDVTTSPYVRSLLTAPIITNGEVIGFINLDSTQVHNFTREQEYQLMAFANQAAIAIQQASLIEKLQDYTGKLEKRVSERTKELMNSNAELEQAQMQLAEERNLLRRIIDTIPDSIYVKDRQSRFIMANKSVSRRTYGIESENDLIGKTDADFYPEIAKRTRQEETAIMTSGVPRINQSEVYPKADGTVTHLLITKMPLRDSNGEVQGVIGVTHDITQLRQAEARLEQVVKSARCLLWSAVVKQDGDDQFTWNYQIVNENAAQNFLPLSLNGKSYTERWLATIPPTEQAQRHNTFETLVDTDERDYHLEYAIHLDDNRLFWLREAIIIEQLDDKRWKLVGVCTDITNRKVAEDRLMQLYEELELRVAVRTLELTNANADLSNQIAEREKAEAAERQQRIIAEAIRDSVAKLSSSLELEEIFDHILSSIESIVPHDASNIMLLDSTEVVIIRASGYDKDIVGIRYQIADLPDLEDIIETGLPNVISDVKSFSKWHDRKTTTWIACHLAVPIKLNDKVIGIINIDSRKINNFSQEQAQWMMTFGDQAGIAIRNADYTATLEGHIEERTSDLEFERAQLNAILNGVADGVMYTDMKRVPQYVNQALIDLLGFTQDEWVNGTAQANINIEPAEHLTEVWNRILRWLGNHEVWTGETEFKHKDGNLFEASMTRTTVKNQQGEAVGIVTVIRDISDEKRLEEQKARFITIAAHELRTPIANLKTRLFLMRRKPEKFTEHIAVAESVVSLMQNLVEHMFDLSRFERGIIEINREVIELHGFLKEVIEYQTPEADRLKINLRLELPTETIILKADPFRLSQVFINLIANALKYTTTNSEIVIIVEYNDTHALIDVRDSGAGIAAEHLPNLFQPFYQASKDHSGAGLGLAIVNEIITAHNGNIAVDSELGKGTTFHIHLPLQQIEAEF